MYLRRAVVYSLGRTPSLVFLGLLFLMAALVILTERPLVLILPFALLAGLVVGIMVRDTLRSRVLLEAALHTPVTTEGITTPRLAEHVRRAVEYRTTLRTLLLQRDPDAADLTPLEDGVNLVRSLCAAIQRYEDDALLAADRRRLEKRGLLEPSEQAHLRSLYELQEQMEAAERQAQSLLATLGESYGVLRRLDSVHETDGRAPEVLEHLRGSAQELKDKVQALEDLYRELASPGTSGATP